MVNYIPNKFSNQRILTYYEVFIKIISNTVNLSQTVRLYSQRGNTRGKEACIYFLGGGRYLEWYLPD